MKRRPLVVLLAVVTLLVLAAIVLPFGSSRCRRAAQQEWKRNAMAEIARLSSDGNWIANEIAALQAQPEEGTGSPNGWLSGHMILLRTGEWVVYSNICHKEDWRMDDLFIGKASDGKWYYSTFHFCIGMIVLPMMGRPKDLPSFKNERYLREFSGSAEEELGKTWPLAPK